MPSPCKPRKIVLSVYGKFGWWRWWGVFNLKGGGDREYILPKVPLAHPLASRYELTSIQ